MKNRDLILAQIQHRETVPVPYTLEFEGDIAERLDKYYGSPAWHDRIQQYIKGTGIVDTMKKMPTETAGLYRDLFGTVWRLDRRPFHLEQPGLLKPSFDNYHWPKPQKFYANEAEINAAKIFCEQNKSDYFLNAWLGWGLFETSWGLRGFENTLIDVVSEPEFHEKLLDRITEQFLQYIDFTCRHLPDIDAIMFGDDWGDQRGVIIGPDRWRQLYKPRYAKLYDAVHAHGKLVISHCCGSICDIMPDIIEIGLDVLESVQPEARGMNPYDLKKQWGDKITFWGCLGSQSTLAFGTPQEIHQEVQQLRREMARGGGFILAPAKALQPGMPLENAVAAVEAFIKQ